MSGISGMTTGVRCRAARIGSLVVHPHPDLDRPSFEVDPCDPTSIEVAAALIGTMKATPGCWSLSAPQLGHHGRILCVDVRAHEDARSPAGLLVLANPEVLSLAGSVVMREECTSFPHILVDVGRASRVVVAGIVPGSGRHVVVDAEGIEARCLLHEIDHLDGISMLDRVVDPQCQLHERRSAGNSLRAASRK